jgi:hypothetical protein
MRSASRDTNNPCCGWTRWTFHEELRSSAELCLVVRLLRPGTLRFFNTWEAGVALFDARSTSEAEWPTGAGAGTYVGQAVESGMAAIIGVMAVEYSPVSWHGVSLGLGGQFWRMPAQERVYGMVNQNNWWTSQTWVLGPADGWFAEWLVRLEYRLPLSPIQ